MCAGLALHQRPPSAVRSSQLHCCGKAPAQARCAPGAPCAGDPALANGEEEGAAAPWMPLEAVPQRDADLLHFFTKYTRAQVWVL